MKQGHLGVVVVADGLRARLKRWVEDHVARAELYRLVEFDARSTSVFVCGLHAELHPHTPPHRLAIGVPTAVGSSGQGSNMAQSRATQKLYPSTNRSIDRLSTPCTHPSSDAYTGSPTKTTATHPLNHPPTILPPPTDPPAHHPTHLPHPPKHPTTHPLTHNPPPSHRPTRPSSHPPSQILPPTLPP